MCVCTYIHTSHHQKMTLYSAIKVPNVPTGQPRLNSVKHAIRILLVRNSILPAFWMVIYQLPAQCIIPFFQERDMGQSLQKAVDLKSKLPVLLRNTEFSDTAQMTEVCPLPQGRVNDKESNIEMPPISSEQS